MQLTPNYRLMKPDGTDPVNVQDLNSNMDALDDELIKKLDKTGDASNVVTKFSQATSRNNLTPGEKLSLSLGKIAKWFADMKTVAFSGKYTDLTERPTIPAGGIADASKIIDNVDDISALTQSGYIMGGLAGKQLISDLADGQIEFDLQNGKGVYRQKGADTWLPFRQPIVIDAIYATYGASGMNVNGGGGVTGLNVEGYSKVSMGPFTYVKNRTFYISYTKKDGTVISHNKTASFTSFEFELVDAVKLSMYMSGFSAEAVSECKNIIIT